MAEDVCFYYCVTNHHTLLHQLTALVDGWRLCLGSHKDEVRCWFTPFFFGVLGPLPSTLSLADSVSHRPN